MEQSKKAFKEFIELCEDVTFNDTVVLELLQKRYNNTNPHFLWSSEFLDLVNRCRQKILADRNNKYVFIKEFTTELKAYKAKPLKHLCHQTPVPLPVDSQTRKRELSSDVECSSKRQKLEDTKDERPCHQFGRSFLPGQIVNPSCTLIPLSLMSEMMTELTENRSCAEGVTGDDSGDAEAKGRSTGQRAVEGGRRKNLEMVESERKKSDIPDDSEASSSYQRVQLIESEADCQSDDVSLRAAERACNILHRQEEAEDKVRENRLQKVVDRLEALLKKISDEIRRLQETELTLDDMDQQDSTYTLEDRYKKRFVKVWNRLCRLKDQRPTTGRETERRLHYNGTNYPEINRRISRFVNKFNVFPDYGDIHEIIEKCNERNDLGMCKSAVDRLSRNTFTDVGNILQKRRITDFAENFGCHLTDEVRSRDDPARSDWSLRQTLDSNRKISKMKLDEVINTFAQKQETEGDDDDDDDDEEEEEEEEDDDKAVMDEMQSMEEMEDVLDIVDEGKEDESQEEVEEEEEDDDDDLEGGGRLMRESEDVVCSDERKIAGALDEGSVSAGDDEETERRRRRTPVHFLCPVEAVAVEEDRAEEEEEEEEDATHSLSGHSRNGCLPSKESNLEPEVSSSAGSDDQREDFISDSGFAERFPCGPTTGRSRSTAEVTAARENVRLAPRRSFDVICVDEDSLLSPAKGRGGASSALHSHLSKLSSDLTLTAVKLNAPSESVLKKYARNCSGPSSSAPVGNDTTLLSDDDDVIVVNSGDQRADGVTCAAQRVTVTEDGDCILSTVEEQFTKRDTRSSADERFAWETTTRRQMVFSQIVRLRHRVPTQSLRRQHNGPRLLQTRGSGRSRDPLRSRPSVPPLHPDLERISGDIAASVFFRNQQKKKAKATDDDGDDLQVAVQPPPNGQAPDGALGLQTTPTPGSGRRRSVGKSYESTSQRLSKLGAKKMFSSSPRISIANRPLRQKNAGFSEVIELN